MKIRFAPLLLALAWAGPSLAGDFQLTSPDFAPGARLAEAQVFKGFGCAGGNVSPALHWSGAPEGTRSFAVTVYDPDAPTGSGWWQWLVCHLPADTQGLKPGAGDPKAGLLPGGAVQSRTDFNQPGYGGPCPPVGHGTHRYVFTVHAVDVPSLGLGGAFRLADVQAALEGHVLASASTHGTYTLNPDLA